MPEAISCESRISSVVVYARGAVVTRKVELPAGLPNESVDLHVGGITPMAEPGSVRTSVDGERGITGLTAPLVWPETKQPTPPDQAAIKAKQRELRRNQQRQNRLRHRLQLLEGIGLSADLQAQKPRHDEEVVGINERLGAATETSDMIHELLTRIDAELRELARSEEKLDEELFNLQRHSKPAPSGEQKREVRITLAPGSDHLRALEISYNVSAARWWPAYAARLSDGGRNAEFAVEAFVAQQTLEDWKDAEISLCTADMISDLTLPELQSLRLGRKQPPKRSGFREPPEGLDALFKGHDEAFGGPGEVFKRAEPLPPPMPKSAPAPVQAQAVASEVAFAVGAAAPEDYDDEMLSDIGEGGEAAESEEYVMLDVDENRFGSQRRSPDEKAKKAGAPMRSRGIGAAASAPGAAGGAMAFDMADAMPAEEPEPETTGVDEQWLDFDSLELAPNTTDRRGRLVHGRSNRYGQAGNLANAIDSLSAPGNSSDPLYSRGQFDHRFDADGLVEISCSGVPQRVRLLAKSAKSRMAFRCVPLEDERVFREVEIENPLEAPLLPGPVDVFMDGALLVTSRIDTTDRGGTIRFGLGEEQRLRVIRNVRAREETKGMFGGKTVVDHDIELEAASSLAGDVLLELVDRIPVSSDDEIDIELLSSEPKAEPYRQLERNRHVEGGLRWQLPVKAGATAKASFKYRIAFDKDFELNGGNRRE